MKRQGPTLSPMEQERILSLLRAEVERLSSELQETTQEKVQAATYGLAVLEENADLKQKYGDLETELESHRLELHQLKEALAECHSNHKRATFDGENREECLLLETASKEAKLMERIEELQNDIKQMRFLVTNTSAENDRLSSIIQELRKECKCIETEKALLKDEVKQYKMKELRQLQDTAELKEENLSLQKQISCLKETQVEYEGLRREVQRRDEEIELRNSRLAEVTRQKEISDHHLEEALETLQSEREQKNELRRVLSGYINTYDSLGTLPTNFEDLNQCNDDELGIGYNNQVFRNRRENMMSMTQNSNSSRPQPGLVCDLLSELSLSEIQKLNQQLLQVDHEKTSLISSIKELQTQLDSTKDALSKQQAQNNYLLEQIQALNKRYGSNELSLLFGKDGEKSDASGVEHRCAASNCSQVARLKNELQELNQKYQDFEAKYKQDTEAWQEESQNLTEKIRFWAKSGKQKQEIITNLENELQASRKRSSEFQSKLSLAQEELQVITEDLANMYRRVCVCNNLLPDRGLLDGFKDGQGAPVHTCKRHANDVTTSLRRCRSQSNDLFVKVLFSPETSTVKSGSSNQSVSDSPCESDGEEYDKEPESLSNQISIIGSQVKQLQTALAISLRNKSLEAMSTELKDKNALVDEIMKLKSLLNTQREQIATLRTVLKANKQAAEGALSNMKRKYEDEKSVVSETMSKLRHELKVLKEDAATFSSLRAVFASRCDEYVLQLGEIQQQLAAAEEEKKTLKSLLSLAIQQKRALTQRLEALQAQSTLPLNSRAKVLPDSKGRPFKGNWQR
ncbi:protein bicaudal D homolog 2-like isoform X2 [Monodelphis domestica]|uniref:Protein bicaudal D homolog 2-like n=1 Tax=Monodelphis domestica TaxID=13616 RepID=F6UHH2_MONDO|nr:protein bicaudal D homolog 2-like isoform X2 [Monodelphis domestica]